MPCPNVSGVSLDMTEVSRTHALVITVASCGVVPKKRHRDVGVSFKHVRVTTFVYIRDMGLIEALYIFDERK